MTVKRKAPGSKSPQSKRQKLNSNEEDHEEEHSGDEQEEQNDVDMQSEEIGTPSSINSDEVEDSILDAIQNGLPVYDTKDLTHTLDTLQKNAMFDSLDFANVRQKVAENKYHHWPPFWEDVTAAVKVHIDATSPRVKLDKTKKQAAKVLSAAEKLQKETDLSILTGGMKTRSSQIAYNKLLDIINKKWRIRYDNSPRSTPQKVKINEESNRIHPFDKTLPASPGLSKLSRVRKTLAFNTEEEERNAERNAESPVTSEDAAPSSEVTQEGESIADKVQNFVKKTWTLFSALSPAAGVEKEPEPQSDPDVEVEVTIPKLDLEAPPDDASASTETPRRVTINNRKNSPRTPPATSGTPPSARKPKPVKPDFGFLEPGKSLSSEFRNSPELSPSGRKRKAPVKLSPQF